jgi:hypothetical protein
MTVEQKLLIATIALTPPLLWLIDRASAAFWKRWHGRRMAKGARQ